jgi:hypothetical protein
MAIHNVDIRRVDPYDEVSLLSLQDGCITGQAYLGLSQDTSEHYFYGSVGAVTLHQFLKACDIHVQLPAAMATSGFPSGLKVGCRVLSVILICFYIHIFLNCEKTSKD